MNGRAIEPFEVVRAAGTQWVQTMANQRLHRTTGRRPVELFEELERGAMLAHRTVLYPRPGYEKRCVDCHYDLVHTPRPSHQYSQTRAVPYQAKGLRTLYGDQL